MEYNIYCDESSHLRHSDNKIMTMGFICCPKSDRKKVNHDLKELKSKHNLSENYELKWTKVSKAKIDYYKDLIDYFCDNKKLSSRVIIADKSTLNYDKYNLSHDDWYYRIYYLLLGKTLDEGSEYNIFLDIKDTNSNQKIKKLQTVLNNSYYSFAAAMIKGIQHIRSEEVELVQLTDLIIGAVAYKNNRLTGSPAKLEIAEYLSEKTGKVLTISTSPYERKFNIFKWEASYHE